MKYIESFGWLCWWCVCFVFGWWIGGLISPAHASESVLSSYECSSDSKTVDLQFIKKPENLVVNVDVVSDSVKTQLPSMYYQHHYNGADYFSTDRDLKVVSETALVLQITKIDVASGVIEVKITERSNGILQDGQPMSCTKQGIKK